MLPNDRLGVRSGKAQNEHTFWGLSRKRTYLPILELLPPPAFCERRHRGLARRRAVRRCAVLVISEGERPHPGLPYGHCRRPHDAADHDVVGETSKSSSFHSPDGRETEARLRMSEDMGKWAVRFPSIVPPIGTLWRDQI